MDLRHTSAIANGWKTISIPEKIVKISNYTFDASMLITLEPASSATGLDAM